MSLLNTNFKQGDLVIADVLFSEQVGAKRRLALVISNNNYNAKSEDLVILKVTSAYKKTNFDVVLENANTKNNSLKKSSFIMVDFPMTIHKGNIYSAPDAIKKEKLNEVKTKILELYDI